MTLKKSNTEMVIDAKESLDEVEALANEILDNELKRREKEEYNNIT